MKPNIDIQHKKTSITQKIENSGVFSFSINDRMSITVYESELQWSLNPRLSSWITMIHP
jgi:hypothetical protein